MNKAAINPCWNSASEPALATTPSGALQALCVLARLHHCAGDPAQLRHALGRTHSEDISVADLLQAARTLGLRAKRVRSHTCLLYTSKPASARHPGTRHRV